MVRGIRRDRRVRAMHTRRAMRYLACLVFMACGTSEDTRPETADYIVQAVLVPYCARAGCHSASAQAKNIVFDNIPDAIGSMQPLIVPGDPERSRLVTILTDPDKPMPPDAPLPHADIDLIARWIANGAEGMP
jgi:cytochrome c